MKRNTKKKTEEYREVRCGENGKYYELNEGKDICPACGEKVDQANLFSGHTVYEYADDTKED